MYCVGVFILIISKVETNVSQIHSQSENIQIWVIILATNITINLLHAKFWLLMPIVHPKLCYEVSKGAYLYISLPLRK